MTLAQAAYKLIDPIRIMQMQGQVYPLQSYAGGFSTNNNQAVVSAVSGQRVRVMGFWTQAASLTQGAYAFKSNSGGTFLTPTYYCPPVTDPVDKFPLTETGYFETSTGHGLYVDVTTTLQLTLFYIQYTP